jgi:hypothetical protein
MTWLRTRAIGTHSIRLLVIGMLVGWAGSASAQEGRAVPSLRELATRVVADPTTYAPTIIVYTARQLDWSSSQSVFKLGYIEANPGYTVTGRPNDTPISYAAGNRRLARETVGLFGWSVANNASCAVIERALMARAPGHHRLIRTLGWLERAGFASYWSHRLSKPRFEQWQTNERLVRELSAR